MSCFELGLAVIMGVQMFDGFKLRAERAGAILHHLQVKHVLIIRMRAYLCDKALRGGDKCFRGKCCHAPQ